jgi:hypothetical protein
VDPQGEWAPSVASADSVVDPYSHTMPHLLSLTVITLCTYLHPIYKVLCVGRVHHAWDLPFELQLHQLTRPCEWAPSVASADSVVEIHTMFDLL